MIQKVPRIGQVLGMIILLEAEILSALKMRDAMHLTAELLKTSGLQTVKAKEK